jgi:regulatory protein
MEHHTATITKIEFQKKNKNRCSVFLDDEFAFGLDAGIVIQHGLKKGEQLTAEQISEILFKQEKQLIKEKAYQFLARRAHSEKELRTKLLNKGFEKNLVDEILSQLKQQKLIDDAAFAHSFVRSRLASKPLGELALRRELRNKGITEEQISAVLQITYNEKSQIEYARELVQKKLPQFGNLDDRVKKKRLANFLVRRGFDWELVKDVLNEKFKSED